MKNRKIGLVSGILVSLFLAGSVLGAVGYVREPSGYTISNPVSFSVSNANDFCDTYAESVYYQLDIRDLHSVVPIHKTEVINLSTPTHNFVETLELGIYYKVYLNCLDSGELLIDSIPLEKFETEIPIFEVVEGEPPTPPVFFDDMGGLMTGTVAMAGTLFTDLAPALMVGLGLTFALTYVLPKIIAILRRIN